MAGRIASSGGSAWWVLGLLLLAAPAVAQTDLPSSPPAAEAPPPVESPAPADVDEPPPLPPEGSVADAPPANPLPVLPGTPDVTVDQPAPPPPLLSPGLGKGPGLPWQVVLLMQLLSYAAADSVPYLGCVALSWVMSLAVPFGPGVLLPITVSAILIPAAAVISGCTSGALLQWMGDRLGTQRGRLACVGCSSISLSALTYSLVIAPILLGMGFFAVAAYLAISTYLVGSEVRVPGPFPRAAEAVGYSVTAGGAALAVLTVALGAILAPAVGFLLRPALVALMYQFTSREREAGEEQWPPSLVGERSDRLPWRRRRNEPRAPAPPSAAPAHEDASGSVAY